MSNIKLAETTRKPRASMRPKRNILLLFFFVNRLLVFSFLVCHISWIKFRPQNNWEPTVCNNWAWLWLRPLAVFPLLAWPKYVYIDPVYETALFSLDCIWNNVVRNVAVGGDRVTDVALMSLAWLRHLQAPNGITSQSDKRSEVVGDIVNKRPLIVCARRLDIANIFPVADDWSWKTGVWSHETTHTRQRQLGLTLVAMYF